MRHSLLFRLMAALFGVWFTFTLVQPNGMMGMTMSGGGASMGGGTMAGMKTSNKAMSGTALSGYEMSGMAMTVAAEDTVMNVGTHCDPAMETHPHAGSPTSTEQGEQSQKESPTQCDQHDCCCSALSDASLVPLATLAWLPDAIINEDTPASGDVVVYSDGQHRLPFANGPPVTVRA